MYYQVQIFLNPNNIRIFFDLGKMRIHDCNVDLVRLEEALVVKSQTATLCHGKLPKYLNANGATHIGMTSKNKRYVAYQLWVMVANSRP